MSPSIRFMGVAARTPSRLRRIELVRAFFRLRDAASRRDPPPR